GSLPGWEVLAVRPAVVSPPRSAPKRTTKPAGRFLYGPSDPPCKAWVTHRLATRGSFLGVDSGGIVGAAGGALLFTAFRLRLAALEVVAQCRRQTPLRRRLFLLFRAFAHTDRLRLRQPYGKDRAGFGALCANIRRQCRLMLP